MEHLAGPTGRQVWCDGSAIPHRWAVPPDYCYGRGGFSMLQPSVPQTYRCVKSVTPLFRYFSGGFSGGFREQQFLLHLVGVSIPERVSIAEPRHQAPEDKYQEAPRPSGQLQGRRSMKFAIGRFIETDGVEPEIRARHFASNARSGAKATLNT